MGSAFHNPGNYFPFFGKNDSSLCSRRGAGVYNCDSGFCRNERKYKVRSFEYALEPADENSSTEAVFSEVEVTQEGITKGSFEEMRYIETWRL